MNVYYDVEDNHYRTYPDGDIATIDQMRELVENKNLSIVKLQQENQELKLELSGYRQAILKDKEMLGLKEENDKLKKQIAILDKTNKQLISKLDRYDVIVDERDELKKQLTTYQILHRDCKVDNLKNISKIEEMENQCKFQYMKKI